MFPKHSQRKINSEITKMLRAYEALIKNPEKELYSWAGYGRTTTCRMCKLFHEKCSDTCCSAECPLSNGENVVWSESFPCIDYDEHGVDTQWNLVDSLCEENYDDIRDAAKARYAWILLRLKENGYEYK